MEELWTHSELNKYINTQEFNCQHEHWLKFFGYMSYEFLKLLLVFLSRDLFFYPVSTK